MANQIAVSNTQNQVMDLNVISQIGSYGVAELMAMKDTLGKDLTIPQFNLFVHDSVRLGLEPRLKHSFPILYGGKMDFRISFEGYHAMAQKSEGYIGLKMEVVTENEIDEFYAETDDDGEITRVHHKIKFPRGRVVGSYAIAKREGKKNLIVFCDKPELDKYAKINAKFWKLEDGSLDPDMCKKHAGTRAIKGQFSVANVAEESTEAMYGSEPEPYTPQRRDITAEAEAMVNPTPRLEEPSPAAQVNETAIVRQKVASAFKKLGITDKDGQAAYMLKNMNMAGDKPTKAELEKLLRVMEMEIAEKEAAGDELE